MATQKKVRKDPDILADSVSKGPGPKEITDIFQGWLKGRSNDRITTFGNKHKEFPIKIDGFGDVTWQGKEMTVTVWGVTDYSSPANKKFSSFSGTKVRIENYSPHYRTGTSIKKIH